MDARNVFSSIYKISNCNSRSGIHVLYKILQKKRVHCFVVVLFKKISLNNFIYFATYMKIRKKYLSYLCEQIKKR